MTEVVVVHEPQTVVAVTQPGLPGPPGPPGGALAATGAAPPSPAADGQIWRDPAAGRTMIFYSGAWRDQVLDALYF